MCCFFGTARTGVGWCIPGKNTIVGTFPIRTVLENDLFGRGDRGAVKTGLAIAFGAAAAAEEGGLEAGVGSSPATVSWRS